MAKLRSEHAGRLVLVDAYIAKAQPFAQPVLEHVRAAMHEGVPEVEEAIKWSMPFFVYRGVILGNMAAFKAHCSFGLWGRETVAELQKDGVAAGGNMGSFGKIVSVKDLPSKAKLVGYVRAAAAMIDSGERTKAWARPKVAKPKVLVPEVLVTALAVHEAAAGAFAAMSESCRREYCDWIASAKREQTRTKRVAEAVAMIAEGKGRNWKYETR